jgi:hypothetical protein
MQILIIDVAGERAAELAVLEDEMTEDPRCQLVLRGLDEMEGPRRFSSRRGRTTLLKKSTAVS